MRITYLELPTIPPIDVGADGKKRKGVWVQCEGCTHWFASRLIRGKAIQFCSKECRTVKCSITLICSQCNATFTRFLGVHTQVTKTNTTNLVFCSRSCKDLAQRLEGGFPELWPSHFGTGLTSYRDKAFKIYDCKCADCDLVHFSILQVHHKDGNRNNNVSSNLEILCRNHHSIRHMIFSTEGIWIPSNKDITPRDKLDEVRKLLGL